MSEWRVNRMKQNEDFTALAKGAGIIVALAAAGAIVGEAPIGFFLGCVAAVFYLRNKDEERGWRGRSRQ
jgi:hypothetical protein